MAETEIGGLFVKLMVSSRDNGTLAKLKGLSGTGFLVLLALATHIGADNVCWPSQKRLAAITGCSLPSVKRAIGDLATLNAIEVETHGGPGGRVNRYRLNPLLLQFGDGKWQLQDGNSND